MSKRKWDIGSFNKGKHLPTNTKQKISSKIKEGFAKGRRIWNEGKNLPETIRKRISLAKKGSIPWNKGIPRTDRERRKISIARHGKPAWNRGVNRTDEEKQKMREGAKRMWERRRSLAPINHE